MLARVALALQTIPDMARRLCAPPRDLGSEVRATTNLGGSHALPLEHFAYLCVTADAGLLVVMVAFACLPAVLLAHQEARPRLPACAA